MVGTIILPTLYFKRAAGPWHSSIPDFVWSINLLLGIIANSFNYLQMSFKDKLTQIDQLQQTIEQHGPLGKELLNKINYKFRLDWNYYSNRMEGNTLTIEETKSVMLANVNINNKPLKDVLEMKGHDDTIQLILKIGKGEQHVSEKRIREIHKAIMYEEQPTERGKIGEWKTQDNHVINYKGEKFDFTAYADVPGAMHELMNWLNAQKEKIASKTKDALHPVQLAFEFHLRYLTIHPFYDGNGRTGRILTNLILISHGHPPIYIKDEEKTNYYRFLADVQAYEADKLMLFDLMAGYLIRSLQVVQDVIAGKDIEEPDDLDKKIQLLELELKPIDPDNEIKMKFGKKAFLYCYETWIKKLLGHTIPVIQKFNKLYEYSTHYIMLNEKAHFFTSEPGAAIIDQLSSDMMDNIDSIVKNRKGFLLGAVYERFKKGGVNTFPCNYNLSIRFDEIKYEIIAQELSLIEDRVIDVKLYERLLHQPLTDQEMQHIAQTFGNNLFNHIDFYTKKNGLR
jgi:Fic family protein